MKIIKASFMGMCFGVRQALEKTLSIQSPDRVTIYGELVHNEEIQEGLKKWGFQSLGESEREQIPNRSEILITAHGISEMDRMKLLNAGKKLIDTTCPLVQYLHRVAQRMQNLGYLIVLIGKREHVEMQGVIKDLQDYRVVERLEEVQSYEKSKIAVLCQTTAQPDLAYQLWKEIKRKNPGREVRYCNTICHPTRDRQDAMKILLTQIDAMVVVGGKKSNNTIQLVKLAQSRNIPVLHIQQAQDIDPDWFVNYEIIGLTAGTSTPDWVIKKVYQRLIEIELLMRKGDYFIEKSSDLVSIK